MNLLFAGGAWVNSCAPATYNASTGMLSADCNRIDTVPYSKQVSGVHTGAWSRWGAQDLSVLRLSPKTTSLLGVVRECVWGGSFSMCKDFLGLSMELRLQNRTGSALQCSGVESCICEWGFSITVQVGQGGTNPRPLPPFLNSLPSTLPPQVASLASAVAQTTLGNASIINASLCAAGSTISVYYEKALYQGATT